MDESKTRAWNEYYSNAVSRLTSIHELDVYWAFKGGWDAAYKAADAAIAKAIGMAANAGLSS